MGTVMGKTVSPDPTANTTSATQLMMGLAGSITLIGTTPRLIIMVTGVIWSSWNAPAQVQLRYGTSATPVNGAVATGTVIGAAKNLLPFIFKNHPVALCGVVFGLSPGVPYWIDVGLARTVGVMAEIWDVDIVAIEG